MILAALATRTGQFIAGVIGLGFLWSVWIIQHDRKVIEKHSARVEKQAEKKDAKAQTARTLAADDPRRVLNKSCRDCGQSGSVQIVETGNSVTK